MEKTLEQLREDHSHLKHVLERGELSTTARMMLLQSIDELELQIRAAEFSAESADPPL